MTPIRGTRRTIPAYDEEAAKTDPPHKRKGRLSGIMMAITTITKARQVPVKGSKGQSPA